MLPFDRHQAILDLLDKHHSMTVKRLAELLHISEPTLRRDLATLEKQGYVHRVFGGVVLSRYANTHLPLSARQQENKLAKADVAAKAADFIPDGSVILLDGSSTCQLMMPHLKHFQKLTVISHSLTICKAAAEMNHSVYCIGGSPNPMDFSNTGYYSELMVRMMHADMMFFSCSGLSMDGELSGVFESGISYLHAAIQRATARYLLCDNGKLGKTFPYVLCTIEDLDGVFCDVDLPPELLTRIGKNRPVINQVK